MKIKRWLTFLFIGGVVFLAISFLFLCCSYQKEHESIDSKKEILGLWYFLKSDSSYAEIYNTDSLTWYFQADDFGYSSYVLDSSDSLIVIRPNRRISRFKVTWVNDSTYVLKNSSGITSKYHKIKDSNFSMEEWQKIIMGDTILLGEYRIHFYNREYQIKDAKR